MKFWSAGLFAFSGSVAARQLTFSLGFSDDMVLQRAPQQAAVYGLGADDEVDVTVTDSKGSDPVHLKAEVLPDHSWRVLLPAKEAESGVSYTILASSGDNSANISRVLYGDVLMCMGQSNMWLPMSYTFERFQAFDAVAAGKYANFRIFNYGAKNADIIRGSGSPLWVSDAAADKTTQDVRWLVPSNDTLIDFASTCWYTAQELADRRSGAEADVPLGLLHSAVGGTQIGQWARKDSLTDVCTDQARPRPGPTWGSLYNNMVAPFLNTTVATVLWYQGENDLGQHIAPGSILNSSGYACGLETMLKEWRATWSKVPGTTKPDVPVGVFTIAPAGAEGSPLLPEFRVAQTLGYGHLPSPALENSFLVTTHDLGDPCYKHDKHPQCVCNGEYTYKACDNPSPNDRPLTPFRDSRIHSRAKRPVGRRAGYALHNLLQGTSASVGPVLKGCQQQSNATLQVSFDKDLLAGRSLEFRSSFAAEDTQRSALEVLDCHQEDPAEEVWTFVNVSVSSEATLDVDISVTSGAICGIRYAWSDEPCCASNEFCTPGSCPLWAGGDDSDLLPALPFKAEITEGHCKCQAPQTCDGPTSFWFQV